METLKNIASKVKKSEESKVFDKVNELDKANELIVGTKQEDISKIQEGEKIDIKEKLDNIKILFSNFGKSFTNEINRPDEVLFDQFSILQTLR